MTEFIEEDSPVCLARAITRTIIGDTSLCFQGTSKTHPFASMLQVYLAHKKPRPPLGPPEGPRHRPTVGSYGQAFPYE
jgi:hypothetical protein